MTKHGSFTITYQDGKVVTYLNSKGVDWYELNLRTDSTVMKVAEITNYNFYNHQPTYKEVNLHN